MFKISDIYCHNRSETGFALLKRSVNFDANFTKRLGSKRRTDYSENREGFLSIYKIIWIKDFSSNQNFIL